jgi:ATP phosphoribosyltransferase regulatory subunit
MSGEETATGMSLYPDALLRAVPAGAPRQRVFIPLGADPAQARALRAKGLATLAQLGPADTPASLRCTHILDSAGGLSPVTE